MSQPMGFAAIPHQPLWLKSAPSRSSSVALTAARSMLRRSETPMPSVPDRACFSIRSPRTRIRCRSPSVRSVGDLFRLAGHGVASDGPHQSDEDACCWAAGRGDRPCEAHPGPTTHGTRWGSRTVTGEPRAGRELERPGVPERLVLGEHHRHQLIRVLLRSAPPRRSPRYMSGCRRSSPRPPARSPRASCGPPRSSPAGAARPG